MSTARISPFQVVDAKWWAGMTTDAHLAALYEQKPQLATQTVNRMLETTFGPSLETILNKFPSQTFTKDEDLYWKLQGSFERNIALKEAWWAGSLVTAADTGVGANHTEIELVFGEYWFEDQMVIVGELNEIYPLYVDRVEKEGSDFRYFCILQYASNDGMPGSQLQNGKRFSIEFTPVERTLSVSGTGVRHSSPIEMRSSFTTVRKEEKVPGSMVSRPVQAFFKNPVDGSTETVWTEYLDWMLDRDFMIEKNRALMFARTNRNANGQTHMTGKSGNDIYIGPGIREQMEVSNTMYYSKFSLALLETFLFDISEGTLPKDQRTFMIKTGERGAALFHKAVKNDASGWLPLRDNTSMYVAGGNSLANNPRGFGFQFTEWQAPNGIRVIVDVDPFYTDITRNKIKHPDGGKAESYRMDIFDIGTPDAPNIQKAYVSGMEDILRYEIGMRFPWDASKTNRVISNSEDSYTIHRMCQFGAMVLDPQRTASFIPNVLSA